MEGYREEMSLSFKDMFHGLETCIKTCGGDTEIFLVIMGLHQ